VNLRKSSAIKPFLRYLSILPPTLTSSFYE
jgi:hypothetical protein